MVGWIVGITKAVENITNGMCVRTLKILSRYWMHLRPCQCNMSIKQGNLV